MNSKQLSIFDKLEKPEKLTQGMKILNYLWSFGSITPVEALRDLGVMRLAARISDLEDQGFEIEHGRESGKNRWGEKITYAKYSLKPKAEVSGT